MFYIIELENNKFLCEHEMIGIYTVKAMEDATVFNEQNFKKFFEHVVLKDHSIYDEEELLKIKFVHTLNLSSKDTFEDILKMKNITLLTD